jgi:hypothetical protein
MSKRLCGQLSVGSLVVIGLLLGSIAPGHAMSRGMGRGGVISSQAVGGSHVFVNNRVFVGSRVVVNNRVFVGSRVFVAPRLCCFGPRFFFGVGVGVPFWYPYPYPYPVYSPPTYVQQDPQYQPQYWYYCPSAQGYYPFVKECPGGWLQVVPQSSPPSL